jgi:hypothetical protein
LLRFARNDDEVQVLPSAFDNSYIYRIFILLFMRALPMLRLMRVAEQGIELALRQAARHSPVERSHEA